MAILTSVEEKARETAAHAVEKTREAAKQVAEGAENAMEASAKIPSPVFLVLSLGSIVFSLLLFARKKREQAIFVGLWPPTFLVLGLFMRLLFGKNQR